MANTFEFNSSTRRRHESLTTPRQLRGNDDPRTTSSSRRAAKTNLAAASGSHFNEPTATLPSHPSAVLLFVDLTNLTWVLSQSDSHPTTDYRLAVRALLYLAQVKSLFLYVYHFSEKYHGMKTEVVGSLMTLCVIFLCNVLKAPEKLTNRLLLNRLSSSFTISICFLHRLLGSQQYFFCDETEDCLTIDFSIYETHWHRDQGLSNMAKNCHWQHLRV